jgi:hypothetical protein
VEKMASRKIGNGNFIALTLYHSYPTGTMLHRTCTCRNGREGEGRLRWLRKLLNASNTSRSGLA